MDNFELRQVLLGSIDGAFSTLCELFNHESFTSSNKVGDTTIANLSASSTNPETVVVNLLSDDESKSELSMVGVEDVSSQVAKIPTDSLTRDQCQKVQHLYTYFGKIKSCSERLQLLFRYGAARSQIGSSDDLELDMSDVKREMAQLQNEVAEKKCTEEKHLKMICALRNYLMIEINRSEDADVGLKSAEENLVKMTVERNKYRQMAQKMLDTGNQGQKSSGNENGQVVQKSSAINSEMPELYVGTFVRKKFGVHHFFGLIVQFNHPFFKVIYEDSDEEELSFKELSISFWPSSVPSTKAAQCKRHATQAGLYNASEMSCDSTELLGVSGADELNLLQGLVNIRNSGNSNSNKDGVTSNGNTSNDGTSCSSSDSSSSSSKSKGASGSALKRKRSSTGESISERVCSISTRNNGRRGGERDNKISPNRAIYEWESNTAVSGPRGGSCSPGSPKIKHSRVNPKIKIKKRGFSPQTAVLSSSGGSKELIDLSADENADIAVDVPEPNSLSLNCPTPQSELAIEDESNTSEEEIEPREVPSLLEFASAEV